MSLVSKIVPDATKAMLNTLTKSTNEEAIELKDRVGHRIWSPERPSSQVWHNDAPAIVYLFNREHVQPGYIDCSAIFRCYGGSNQHGHARDTWKYLHAHLWECRAVIENMGVMVLSHENTAPERTEPDTRYPVVIATYHIVVF